MSLHTEGTSASGVENQSRTLRGKNNTIAFQRIFVFYSLPQFGTAVIAPRYFHCRERVRRERFLMVIVD